MGKGAGAGRQQGRSVDPKVPAGTRSDTHWQHGDLHRQARWQHGVGKGPQPHRDLHRQGRWQHGEPARSGLLSRAPGRGTGQRWQQGGSACAKAPTVRRYDTHWRHGDVHTPGRQAAALLYVLTLRKWLQTSFPVNRRVCGLIS